MTIFDGLPDREHWLSFLPEKIAIEQDAWTRRHKIWRAHVVCGVKQTDIASELGVSQAMIHQWVKSAGRDLKQGRRSPLERYLSGAEKIDEQMVKRLNGAAAAMTHHPSRGVVNVTDDMSLSDWFAYQDPDAWPTGAYARARTVFVANDWRKRWLTVGDVRSATVAELLREDNIGKQTLYVFLTRLGASPRDIYDVAAETMMELHTM